MKSNQHKRGSSAGRFRAEVLEPRRLLAAQIALDTSTGILSFTQTSGVDDALEVAVSAGHNWFFDDPSSPVSISSTLFSAGWVVTPDTHEAVGPSLSQVSSIHIDTNDGTDTVAIDETSVPIMYQSSGTPDITLTVGDGHAATNDLAPITFDGSTSGAALIVDDTGDTSARTIGLTASAVTGLGPGSINMDSEVGLVLLKPGTGGNAVTVNEANTGTVPTEEIQSIGHDAVDVASSNPTATVNIVGISGGIDDATVRPQSDLGFVAESSVSGSSTITVDDSGDTQPRNITYQPSGSIGEVSGFSSGNVLINGGVNALNLIGGSGGNNWTIDPLSGSHAAVATIDTGAGKDSVQVRDNLASETLNIDNQRGNASIDVFDYADTAGTAFPAASIFGPINVVNSGGSTLLKIDESASPSVHAATVSDTQVSGLTHGVETFSGVANVSLIGSEAGDTFSVTPSTSTAFSIDGGPFAPAPNPKASMNVSIAGRAFARLALTGTALNQSGSYTFADAQPIAFSRMGQIAPVIGAVSGRVYNGQNLNPIAESTVFADDNGNGVADPGEPAVTTDVSGDYALGGIPVGALSLAVKTPTGNFVTQSKSAAISVSTTATADFELLPTASAGKADLVSTLIGAQPASALTGQKLKVKIKVANIGAAAAVGKPVLELFASADTALDETDHAIATLSLGKLNLKPGKSKMMSATFAYPSSVPAGTYFLLASVDSTNVISESNEADNIAADSRATTVVPAVPDLAGKFNRFASKLVAGRPFSESLVVNNLGNGAASDTVDVSLFASADRVVDSADQELVTSQAFHIQINPHKSHVVTLKIPARVTKSGSFYLIAEINPAHTLDESNFANNEVVSSALLRIV